MPELRYKFTATLTALTHLRIGDGGILKGRVIQEAREGEPDTEPEVVTVFTGKNNKPYLPGTSLKGWLRAFAESSGMPGERVERLFGFQKPGSQEDDDSSRGALLRLFDAFHEGDPVFSSEDPIGDYWCGARHTCVASHVVIDRRTRGASHSLLFFEEFVPAGSSFKLTFELLRPVKADEALEFDNDAAHFLALLKHFEQAGGGAARLGSSSVDDWGRVQLTDLKVSSINEAALRVWLGNNNFTAPPMKEWQTGQMNALAEKAEIPESLRREITIPLTIEFEAGFICNDPSRARQKEEAEEGGKGNFEPTRTPEGKPYLPHSSLRGALRSQAEKILRTRRGQDVANPAEPPGSPGALPIIHDTSDRAKLDAIPLLFGAPGIRSVIHFRNQRSSPAEEPLTHELVGLDRFSGAVGKRKFKARYFWQPKIMIEIVLDMAALDWASERDKRRQSASLVLFAQALRDLAEGLVPLGFGAAKGWGRCKATIAPAQGVEALPEDCPAREFFAAGFTPQPRSEIAIIPDLTAQRSKSAGENQFFNPYHFHPTMPRDHTGEPTLEDLKTSNPAKLTLDRYHDGLLTGYLDCLLTADTPLVIGAKQSPVKSEPTPVDLFRRTWNGKEQVTIPATSLRGMISSHFEALTKSALRVLDNEFYSVRKEMAESLSAIGVVLKFGDKWFIKPLCLPTFNLHDRPLDPAWKKLLPNPILKVYNGNTTTQIAGATWIQANPTWMPGKPLVNRGIRLPLTWNPAGDDVLPLAAVHLKPGKRSDYRVAAEPGHIQQTGILRTLGHLEDRDMPRNKTHELFIPAPNLNTYFQNATANTPGLVTLPPEVVQTFERIAQQMTDQHRPQEEQIVRPFEPVGTRPPRWVGGKACPLKLQAGDLVYFSIEGSVTALAVKEISFSSIWRQAVPLTAFQFFARIDCDLLPMSNARLANRKDCDVPITPAEKLFGFVEMREKEDKDKPLKTLASRLRFTDAVYTNNLGNDPWYTEARKWKILSTPKPPSAALYFYDSVAGQYIPKKELGHDCEKKKHRPQGRKFYLHHDIAADQFDTDDAPWCSKSEPDDKNNDQRMSVRPIRRCAQFRFRIHFENLTDVELNLLYTVLRPAPEVRYKLGLGRPLGLGTVRLDPSATAMIVRVGDRYSDVNLMQHLSQHMDVRALANHGLADAAFLALTAVKYKGVEYPRVDDGNRAPADRESELFRWFVANDDLNRGHPPASVAMKSLKGHPVVEPLPMHELTRR